MRIRLGILDHNTRYVNQLANFLATHYAAELELNQFSTLDELLEFIGKKQRIDILLAGQDCLPDLAKIPEKIIVVYFTDDREVSSINGKPALCRFQRAEDIYRNIESLAASIDTGKKKYAVSGKCRTILIAGAAGGMGTSTTAAALAARLAMKNKTVTYFPLQQNAKPSESFHSLSASMTKVRYEVRSSMVSGNDQMKLQLKLKGMMIRDASTGVCAFDAFELPIERKNISRDEVSMLMGAMTGISDYCIFDIDNNIDDIMIKLMDNVDWIVFVTDGSEKANSAVLKMLRSIELLENAEELSVEGRIGVIYNRFGSHSAEITSLPERAVTCAKFANYKNAPTPLILQELVGKSFGALEE